MPIFINELPSLPELYGQFGSPVLQEEYKCSGSSIPKYWKYDTGQWLGFTLAPFPEVKLENTPEEQELIDVWAPRILDVPAVVIFRPYGYFHKTEFTLQRARFLCWHKNEASHWTVEIERGALYIGQEREVILALLNAQKNLPGNYGHLFDFLISKS